MVELGLINVRMSEKSVRAFVALVESDGEDDDDGDHCKGDEGGLSLVWSVPFPLSAVSWCAYVGPFGGPLWVCTCSWPWRLLECWCLPFYGCRLLCCEKGFVGFFL